MGVKILVVIFAGRHGSAVFCKDVFVVCACSVRGICHKSALCMHVKKIMWEKEWGDLFQPGSICTFGSGRTSRCVVLQSVDKVSASRRACWWRYLWYVQVRLVLANSSHSYYTVQLKILRGRWLGNWKFLLKLKRVFTTVHGPWVIESLAVWRHYKPKTENQAPGRMGHAPLAGTGDSACRSWLYRCLVTLNLQGHLSMCGTFLIRSLPPYNNRG